MKEFIKKAFVDAMTGLLSLLVMVIVIVGFMWLGAEAAELYNSLPMYTQ